MTVDAFKVVREFEAALCEYTGAPYAVTTTSCTMALLLAVAWQIRDHLEAWSPYPRAEGKGEFEETVIGTPPKDGRAWRSRRVRPLIDIPKRTYVSVPMSIIHAGGWPTFRDEEWLGGYQLKQLPVWDCARRFTSGMFPRMQEDDAGTRGPSADTLHRQILCVSFHHSKILGDSQGGAILHDDREADKWLRRARFDGRTEGLAPKDDDVMLGWHCYLSPDVAARLLWKLSKLPLHNDDLPNDDYPDLSKMEIFQ